MVQSVYLDYNATAPLRPEAASAVEAALRETGNPSSVHGFGRRARRRVEDGREAVSALVGGKPAGVVFTSGGSEANNLALSGLPAGRVLVSAVEHESVLQAAPEAQRLPVDRQGRIDLDALGEALATDGGAAGPTLVSVMLANNETGVIQSVAEIAALARTRGALVHCDAVQGAGRLDIDLPALGVSALSLSAHKLGGPQGAGALVLAEGVALAPLIRGGGQERRRRAGTENVPAIAGFGAVAAAILEAPKPDPELARLRDGLEARLKALAPELVVFGAEAPRLANTSCFALPGLLAETQLLALDLAGIAVSSGAACSSGKVEPSHVLQAMGIDAETAASAIRVSLGWATSEADLERFIEAWDGLYRRRAA